MGRSDDADISKDNTALNNILLRYGRLLTLERVLANIKGIFRMTLTGPPKDRFATVEDLLGACTASQPSQRQPVFELGSDGFDFDAAGVTTDSAVSPLPVWQDDGKSFPRSHPVLAQYHAFRSRSYAPGARPLPPKTQKHIKMNNHRNIIILSSYMNLNGGDSLKLKDRLQQHKFIQ